MSKWAAIILLLLLTGFGYSSAYAVTPDEQLSDPVQEQRARKISKKLRCVVCQNQSIDDSDAQLAGDMRRIVRERIVAGDSDEQILKFMVDRYSNFVLMRPPFAANTLILWLSPFLFIILGIGMFWHISRRKPKSVTVLNQTDETEQRLTEVLEEMKKN